MSVTHARTQADPESTSTPGTERRLLQRQIMPKDRDTDVIRLYVDPDPAVLDADKYEIGDNRQARELNAVAMRQAVGTGSQVHPDRIESRTAYRLRPATSCPSAPTSTRSRPPTGAAGPSSTRSG